MEIKKRFKLYKNGKQWCCMAIATGIVMMGAMFGTSTLAQADDTSASTLSPKVISSETLDQQEAASQTIDNTNNGYLDSAKVVNSGDLAVSGWQATNQAAYKPYRYVVAVDTTTNQELGRTQVKQNVARPDVAKAYPQIINANQSGYQATMQNLDWNKVKNVNDQIKLVSRYSSEANGEGQKADYWTQNIDLDKKNYAALDDFSIQNNQLHVAGWNATYKSLGKGNHYLILFDRTAGHELSRQRVAAVARPDVAKVYPQVIGAANSGFDLNFSLANVDFNHELQIISRYSDAINGEGSYVNYWFTPYKLAPANTSNQGYLDSFNISNGGLTVSGWHATDYSQVESNHYVILFDQTSNKQVAAVQAPVIMRTDVAKAYPNVKTAVNSGFKVSFDKVSLIPNHAYTIVSRYSTLNEGNGDNGQSKYTDYWFNPVKLDQQAYSIDSFTTSKDGLKVSGWMASDQHIGRPYSYLILLQNGKEVTRTKLNLIARPDVAKVYPSLYQSGNSGFNALLKINPSKLSGNLQLLFRFTNDPQENGNASDQISPNYPTEVGNFDQVTTAGNQLTVSGWHAIGQVSGKPYEYLIVLDNAGNELGRQRITKTNLVRPDVEKAYPYLNDSLKSGFEVTMPIQENMMHKMVKLIHRITDDPAGNGHYKDLYSGLVSIFSGKQVEGRKTTTYDPNGKIIAVFNDADVISQLPELPTGCEITAVTMMLRYAGYNVNKIQLANEMPRSSNGDYGFVGNPFSASGWWIFPTGIAPVVNHYVGHSEIMTGASMDRIKDKLKQGRLVVAWVANVNGFVNHALALTGYDASRLFYNNPWTGRKESMTYSEFYQHWNADRQRAISY